MKGVRKLNMLFAVVLCLVMFFALAACNNEVQQKLVSDAGITVEGGGFEKGSALVTESIETTGEKGREIVTLLEEQNYNKELQVSIYDIFVAKDGNEVQPDGKVKITIPAPFESENGYVTFHVKDDDSVETLVTTYAEGKISFETDSFSYFVVAAANNPSEAKKYTFTATLGGEGQGTIYYLSSPYSTYQNTVSEGTEIKLRATANGGFAFTGWYVVGEIFDEFISADEEYTFTVNSDMTVYAKIELTFTFDALVSTGSGNLEVDGENVGGVFRKECVVGTTVKVKAIGDENYEFEGWYTSEATPVLISTDAEYTFTIDGNVQVLARFKEKVKSLSLDGANAGFENGQAVYSIGEENQPSPADVIVYGVTLSDRSELTKDVDYTIDLGGLDFEKVGTYTITYTYVKDTTVKATLTVVVEGPNYLLKVGQQGAGGTVSINGGQASSLESNAFSEKFKAKTRITLVAATRTSDYIFLGWYEVDDTVLTHLVLKDTPVSTDATFAFDMPEKAYTVYAVFEAKVTGLILDGANAGFTEGKATYTIGEATRPVPENVVVSGATVLGSVPFTKDVDYTIDLGGLDFERVGTYTITYTYVKDTNIKETLTIDVVEPKYLFAAYIASGSGSISYNGVEQPNGYQAELTAGTKVTLTATPSDGYNFVGWFEPETTDTTALVLKETPVSTSATYEFTVPAKEYRVYAVFEAKVTGLILDGANAGFTEGKATYTIGEATRPVPENVVVSGATVLGSVPFTKDVDYTIDLGGLDFERVGTYTITYTYVKDTNIKETLTIEVVEPKYLFAAYIASGSGSISYNGVEQHNGYQAELTAGTKVTLTAVPSDGYNFVGWFEPETTDTTALVLKETPVSTSATYEFTVPAKEYRVYAVFEAKVTGLILDGANAGFTEGKATYTIGEATRPVPENVVVSGATVLGSVPFTKDVDYTIDLGGLDFERVGTYTITYTYVKDTTIKETLTIEVVEPKYLFGAYIASGMGSISYNGVEQPNGYQAELTAGTKVTLTATPSDGYNFVGWFEPETTDTTALVLKETPVSASATYEFTVPAKEYRVYAVFEEVITYTFSAYITGEGGYFEINGTDGGRDYWAEKLNTGDRITLKVVANRGYEFKGWYAATDVPSFISASAEYTFTVENADISVEAVFEAKVTGLILDGANAGFTEGKATYTIGEATRPVPENVVVSGATVLGSVPFTKDVDYTIDLGGLDFERVGTYTITYTYVKDTNIKETLTIEVVAPKFTFSAVTENANGSIYYNNEVQPNGYQAELEANTSVTLKAVAKNDYEFVGWYTATDVPEFISESAEYTFVTGNADKYVMARFAAKILYLWSDSSNAGFNDNEKSATVTIGDSVLPDPQAVLIYAGTAEGDVLLTKNVDYTIELGGLDFSQEGTYTITYRHTKNTSLTTPLTVYVVAAQAPVTINLSYSGTADPVKYNGGRAAYVFKSSILNNGEACDIESLGLFYEWRDHTTKAVVAVAKDDTWDSTSVHYPSPAVPGTYDFVVYKLENEVKTDLLTVTRTIVENQFAVVTDLSSLSEYVCYTFIAKAGDNYYAMSNPFSGNSEREAILVTPDSNGVISLGNNYEYVFRPYNTGKTSSSGLVCYGCRTGNGLNRTGNLVLWGTGGIGYTTSTSADYTVTFVLNADGTITVHAPFCEGTLRLVYDATSGKFMFTAKKAVDDTRTSYPVYLYGEYTEPVVEPKETYEFFGKLSKAYDGNAVSFNVYKEVNICTENGEDVAAVLKNGTGRFVWTDAKGNVISVGTPDENGNVTGPSAIGSYRLVFQTLQKGENGMEWVEKAVLHSFEITAPAEVN